MKKALLLTCLLMSMVSAYAQISLGVKAGANANTVSFEKDAHNKLTEYKAGFHVGVFSKINLSKRWALIPELQYIRKGYRYNAEPFYSQSTGFIGFRYKYDVNLDYIELPVTLAYSPVRFLNLEWGLVAGQMISASGKLYYGPTYPWDKIFNKSFELGWCGGLRFNLPAGLSVAARYYHGMTRTSDLFYTEDGVNGAYMYQRNRNFQLSVYCTILR